MYLSSENKLKFDKKFYKNSFLFFSFFFFIYAFIDRLMINYFSINRHIDNSWLIILSIFKNDAIIISVIMLLYLFSSTVSIKTLSLTSRISIFFIFLLYCLDLAIFKTFSTRLVLNDFFHYISDILFLPTLFHFSIFPVIFFGITLGVFIISSFVFVIHKGPNNPKILWLILLIALFLGGFYFSDRSDSFFIHNWKIKNFIEVNLNNGMNTPYSKKFISSILKKSIEKNKCDERIESVPRKNIILLILESFSMHHSHFFSGIKNYTPNLDRIVSEGRAFRNFISNGYNTEHALIAIFTGKFPIPGFRGSKYNFFSNYYNGYYNLENALPKILSQNGYYSEFLTTSNLEFSNKGEWLKNLGFDYIEGHDADHYRESKRFHFQAAPDDMLYERVLVRLKGIGPEVNYFMAIQTVSTHLPYIDPITEEKSEQLAVQFADTALGKFYDDLKKTKFFDNGILIIVSDHRSMNMISQKELELFGSKAPALVPLAIIGSGYSGVEKGLFQQTDIFTSITNYVSKKSCTSEFSGDVLKIPSTSAAFAIYVRGDDRNLISVFTKKTHGTIRLEGDRTMLIDGEVEDGQYVVRKINFDRISHQLNFLDSVGKH